MSDNEIQTANPGGVSNRTQPKVVACSLDDDISNRLLGSDFSLDRRNNIPAHLACACGAVAVALVLFGLFSQHYEPRWIGPLWVYLPLSGWFGSLLGVPAFCLGVTGAQPRWLRAADGLHWACIGMLLGVCAMLGAVVLFFEPLSKISGC